MRKMTAAAAMRKFLLAVSQDDTPKVAEHLLLRHVPTVLNGWSRMGLINITRVPPRHPLPKIDRPKHPHPHEAAKTVVKVNMYRPRTKTTQIQVGTHFLLSPQSQQCS
jgi:hypothetical protein